VGGSLRGVHFRDRTGVTVLGIHAGQRKGRRVKLSSHRLESGDMLLLQGPQENLDRLDGDDLMLLQDKSAHHPHSRRATIATIVFLAAIVLASTRCRWPWPSGACRCSSLHAASRSGRHEAWTGAVVLIGAMMAFGAAIRPAPPAGWPTRSWAGSARGAASRSWWPLPC
jgi:hypothetical protein